MQWILTNLNIVGAVASIIGTVIGLPALILALIQLRRTKRAAEAAAESARDALQRISSVVAITSIEQICTRSRDLLHLTRTRSLDGSARAAFELREALAKFSKSNAAVQLQKAEEWTNLLNSIGEIHNALESAAAIRKIDAGHRERLIWRIREMHEHFSTLAAVASERAGEINAYSKRIP